ncbi:uncharacterized protein stbd1 [Sphaeramia orbicularis]|uniref:uncharacterized protein stbd1 n=1 Tax=Sphaeramia orbicularis TaxID=375764 RepID=UPI0011800625|nr:starch-binding domain-containing protein 1 [Sphaeramia orbicularis]
MTLKNPVALERRMDLASLFCMISRHGPAVALAVIAMVSVVAGFIIYRTVRGKRRKAKAEAADGDGHGGGAAEADVGLSPTDGFRGSTDGSDEDSSDVIKVDPDLIQSHLEVRRRRIAIEEEPPKRNEVSDNTHTTSDNKEETAFVWDINSPKATEIDEQEVSRSLQSDMYTAAEMKLEDAVDCQWSDTDKTIEEECGNKSCTEEPELINDESHEEEEQVLKAERPEDDYVTDDDDSAMETRHEEACQFIVNSQVYFKQPPHVSDNGDNDRGGDNSNKAETNSLQSNMEEAVNHSTDLTVPCQSEEGNHLTCSDYSSYTSNNNFSLEKEKENEGEECVDHLQIETESSTFEDASLDTYQHDHNTVLSVSVSGIVTDAKAEISGITDFSDLSLNDEKPQSEQREDETSLTLDNHDDVCLLIPTHETEGEPEKDVDQQEVQVINGEVSEPGFPPVLDKNGCDGENILMAEEISHLHEGMEVKEECKDHQQTEILSSTSEQEKPSQHEQSDHEHDALDMDHDVLCPPISPPETKIQHEMAENGTSVDQQMINDDAPEVNITTADDTNACPHENSLIAKEICNPLEGVHDDSLVSKTANEDTDSSHFNDEQQMDKKYSYNANDGIPSTAVCHVAEESESVVLSLALLCLHEPTDIIKGDDASLPIVSTDAKSEIPGVSEFFDMASNGEHSQPEQTEDEKSPNLDKDTNHDTVCSPVASETQPKKEEDGKLVDQQEIKMINNDALESSGPASNDVVACVGEKTSMGEELLHHNVPPCNEEKCNSETSHIEVFDGDGSNSVEIASVTVEDSSCPLLLSICEDQHSDHMVNTEASGADVVVYDLMAPVMTEEMSGSIISSSCQDQQHENTENGVQQFEVTTGASHDLPIFHNNLLSFNQTELKDSDIDIIPSPAVGVESGISSMAVSPDLQEAGPDIGITVESMTLPVVECDFQVISCHKLEEHIEVPHSFYADDVALSAQRQDTIEPHSSFLSQQSHPEHAEWATYESLAANEDIFGHEVEDCYHKALDQFMKEQFTNNIVTDELKRQTEDDLVIEVVQVKEKKEEACSVKGKEMKAEDEKDEDYERTEISIMEATMDNNEWITESNYQVLPWMNISVPSFAQDYTKPEQKPPEDSTAATDATCTDTSDIPPVVEHTAAEESTESTRKVVAVQPMPQNVNVTFRVHYLSQSPHQTVAVTGNQQELGSWKGFIPLEKAKDGYWSCVVSLPAESHVEWKFVVLDKGKVCRWEECGNRLLDTGFGDDLLVHKWWGFL